MEACLSLVLLLDNAINTKISFAGSVTVKSKTFLRVLFSRNFAYMQSFMKKISRNGKSTLLFTGIGKLCSSHKFLMLQICLLT